MVPRIYLLMAGTELLHVTNHLLLLFEFVRSFPFALSVTAGAARAHEDWQPSGMNSRMA